ncbi:sigma-54-dependent Fis family transcriptional regulator [Massilia sp. TS11]|uniref:sigma-54-dependent Fis family transcriptional regulator n=1 Tax=Massilia sp. TS11 TaxID=2908003 RepID=UPI001EDB4FC3|nr:sigma-54-dependent Fis family transcriptional regulator [Massilia sp. TS11]MCG2584100.1 sigma-54-dependent Fis family transcriptional regulator [Massilia sp. TS11]
MISPSSQSAAPLPLVETAAELIHLSHARSRGFGLDPDARPDFSPIGRQDLSLLVEQNRLLHNHALPAMETLYQQIVNTHNMVLLTDAQGVILHALGDADFLEKASKVALQPGAVWSEQSKGTNGIGTAIADKLPTLIHADQHYLRANHFLSCSAAPILDHQGNVLGVLDVSGDQRSYHKHTMALVRMSALMIENQVFSATFEDAITLHFHARPEFIGTLMEGIASFTPSGRFLAANRSAQFQLGLSAAALQTHTFSSLFGLPVSALMDHYRTAAPGLLDLCLHNGVRIKARAQIRLASARAPIMPAAPAPAPSRLSSLRYLRTGDAQVEALLDKVERVLGKDIPIMILGETGTGKELLARAIHNDSPRGQGPFVAVNCASIPETLIESELFGYEDGAFTGARKKGALGKIQQANGGTLFLDEIGDMPMSMQARLLRVLQERTVTPLGGDKAIPVNVDIICATNHNLRARIAEGAFREDLYFRLNGLVVKLPPLRERSDLGAVVRKILASEGNGQRYALSEELASLFARHQWPGNFRQLHNLLRTALAMAGEDGEICVQHMPDDFLEDVRSAPADLESVAQDAIARTLAAHGGNMSAAARALGISRNTLYRKLAGKGR